MLVFEAWLKQRIVDTEAARVELTSEKCKLTPKARKLALRKIDGKGGKLNAYKGALELLRKIEKA